MNSLRWLDFAIILIYMVGMLVVGLRFAKRQTSTESYFVAKRSIPAWAMGVSMFATLISSITFIAYPGGAYAGNWAELVSGFMVIIVLLIVGEVIIPFFRQASAISLTTSPLPFLNGLAVMLWGVVFVCQRQKPS